jgi:hypothetical protein
MSYLTTRYNALLKFIFDRRLREAERSYEGALSARRLCEPWRAFVVKDKESYSVIATKLKVRGEGSSSIGSR